MAGYTDQVTAFNGSNADLLKSFVAVDGVTIYGTTAIETQAVVEDYFETNKSRYTVPEESASIFKTCAKTGETIEVFLKLVARSSPAGAGNWLQPIEAASSSSSKALSGSVFDDPSYYLSSKSRDIFFRQTMEEGDNDLELKMGGTSGGDTEDMMTINPFSRQSGYKVYKKVELTSDLPAC